MPRTTAKDCKAYPDEKGIETIFSSRSGNLCHHDIAKPIPMKRELKHLMFLYPFDTKLIAKPIPMKRELKHKDALSDDPERLTIAKPIPMKRELKLLWHMRNHWVNNHIAKPIPMKRELKLIWHVCIHRTPYILQSLSR